MNKEEKAEIKKKFGENLKRLRESRGITQEEFAIKLGYVNRSSINKIETGRSDMPRSKIAEAAKILNVSPLELFRNEPLDVVDVEVMVDKELQLLTENYSNLNEANKTRLLAYIQALIDSQGD